MHYWKLAKMAASTMYVCWTKSLKYVPVISLKFVEEWTKHEISVPKRLLIRGYSNFCKGYIFDVERFYIQSVFYSAEIKLIYYKLCKF